MRVRWSRVLIGTGFYRLVLPDLRRDFDTERRIVPGDSELTRRVETMAKDLNALTERADRQQARADSQQDLVDSQQERAQMQQVRIDLAARELGDVSDRLQAAATALRDSL